MKKGWIKKLKVKEKIKRLARQNLSYSPSPSLSFSGIPIVFRNFYSRACERKRFGIAKKASEKKRKREKRGGTSGKWVNLSLGDSFLRGKNNFFPFSFFFERTRYSVLPTECLFTAARVPGSRVRGDILEKKNFTETFLRSRRTRKNSWKIQKNSFSS